MSSAVSLTGSRGVPVDFTPGWLLSKILLLLVLSSHSATAAFYMHRVDRATFVEAPSMFLDEPVVVEDVISPDDCQQWIRHILRRSKDERMQIHRQDEHAASSHMTLIHAAERASHQSSHSNPVYASSIASSCSTDQLPLQDVLHDLLMTDTNQDYDDHFDWMFSCFAKHMPVSDTLVVAGAGSTSPTIQWHPYTKIYTCLQGSMLLRALVPSSHNHDNQLLGVKPEPIWRPAWEEGLAISHGYKAPSKYGLFEYRHEDTEAVVDDEEETSDEDDFQEEKYNDYQEWVERIDLLRPNIGVVPSLEQGDNNGELWHSTVGLPGDVILIPPGWWYQVYHMEPCLAVQSQRCTGSRQAQQFMSHILETSGFGKKKSEALLTDFLGEKEDFHSPEEAQTIVNQLFDALAQQNCEKGSNNSSPSSNLGGSKRFM